MRAWTKNQIRQMEQITVWAAQRCLGIHSQWKRTHHVNAALIQEMVQWEPFEHTIARQSLQWIGHVARMHKDRLPKQALFGSWTNNKIKQHPPWRQGQWIKHLLTQIQVSEMSWFRLAQDRDAWNQAIQQTYPTLVPDTHRTIALNRWTLSAGLVIGGDFNAEVGHNLTHTHMHPLLDHGLDRTPVGREWISRIGAYRKASQY